VPGIETLAAHHKGADQVAELGFPSLIAV
jgi:hypothetical protein